MTRTRPKSHTDELIEAVRRCAAVNMSSSAAAAELTTPARPLTRNAVIGIAHRNGIKFKAQTWVRRKPSNRRKTSSPAAQTKLPPAVQVVRKPAGQSQLTGAGFGAVQARLGLKKPPARCSWVGCLRDAVAGDMFCFPHGRKGLL